MTKANEVAVQELKKQTPADMIMLAVQGGADLDKLEKLMVLQERWEANEARKAYHEAMTLFKANPPRIKKDKKVAFGQTKYNHASLGNVTESINTELSKHGLSASWTTNQNGKIVVTCRITHVKGHSEETVLSSDADKSGAKNDIQAIGSAISYLQRYTLLSLCGLATYEMDDDGHGAAPAFVDESELHQLRDHIIGQELTEQNVCKFLNVESLEKLPKADFKRAMAIKKVVKK